MTYFDPSQLFAQLTKDNDNTGTNETVKKVNDEARRIQLHESGEASLPPDRIRCIIKCVNTKETVDQVKQSVNRRVDYIIQTLRNNQVREQDYKVHKIIRHTDENLYLMSTEVVIEFTNIVNYEKTINFLVEKLENSVQISAPLFFHSSGKLSDLRRQACLNAVRNCRSKALSIAQFLNQTLGSPILIREEDVVEYTGLSRDEQQQENKSINSIQELIESNTVSICVKVYAVFECKERTKKSQKK